MKKICTVALSLYLLTVFDGVLFPQTKELSQFTIAGYKAYIKLDSIITEYYVKQYRPDKYDGNKLHKKVNSILSRYNRQPLEAGLLKKLTRETSLDFATAYFMKRLNENNRNRMIQNRFIRITDDLKMNRFKHLNQIKEFSQGFSFLFVPGFGYRFDTETGADFKRQRHLLQGLGIENELVVTGETGTVEKNSIIIAETIRRYTAGKRKIILISTSKGGAEVAYALGKLLKNEESVNVKAWISIGGLIRGTPLADYALELQQKNDFYIYMGYPRKFLKSISRKKRNRIYKTLYFPEHILKVLYIGVSFSSQIKGNVRNRYSIISKQGPNDGLTLLADELIDNGIVITDIGLDHYYRHPDINSKAIALLYLVCSMVR